MTRLGNVKLQHGYELEQETLLRMRGICRICDWRGTWFYRELDAEGRGTDPQYSATHDLNWHLRTNHPDLAKDLNPYDTV